MEEDWLFLYAHGLWEPGIWAEHNGGGLSVFNNVGASAGKTRPAGDWHGSQRAYSGLSVYLNGQSDYF